MLNKYVWRTYLKAGGDEIVEFFRKNFEDEFGEEYPEKIKRLHKVYCPTESICDGCVEQLNEIYDGIQQGEGLFLEEGEYSIKKAMKALFRIIKSWGKGTEKEIFEVFCNDNMTYFTTNLALDLPELFVPYYFTYNFNVLQMIADEFGINLPPMPKKKDYEGRFYYYGKICEALLDFREENNLTPYELYAFLYDFAPKYIGGIDSYIVKDLPEPKSAYFIGGDSEDEFLTNEKDLISCWQCNPDTRAGDMIVMYLRTPISAVDSIWRSVSIGFNDPFFYYYRCTYIANPIALKRISQKQLEEDKLFKDLPIVRKNMQGINGVELLPSYYNHIVELGKVKKDVKTFKVEVNGTDSNFLREKDVEDILIKQLLKNLGYSEDDYVQQMRIEVGNHNSLLIPDFVLLPQHSKGHYGGFALVEAKLSIPNKKYLDEAMKQARSYAKQLGANYAVVASKEKIWVTEKKDDYTEEIFSAAWNELNDSDMLYTLKKILGKR